MNNYLKNSLFCVVFTLIYYLITFNWVYTIVVFLLYTLFFFLFYETKRKRYYLFLNRSIEAVSYINNFIISLSVTNSVYSTFNKLKENVSNELKLQIDSIEHLDVETKIEYLNTYFELPLYGVFINIIKQYIESGTNILEISQLLIHDTRNLENRIHEFEIVSKKKEKEFLISWGLTFLILVIMQFSLSTLVKNIEEELVYYPILVLVYFVAFLGVYYLYALKIFDTSFIVKGETYHEKNQTKSRKPRFGLKKRNNVTNNS